MLDFLRKKKRSWTIFLVVGGISFVFIFYFGSSGLIEDPTLGPVAKVNGEVITSSELDQLVVRALRSNRNNQQIDEASLRLSLLQDLIQTRLLLQEARRVGLEVTDEELSEAIAQTPVFQTNGQFDKNLYLRLLQLNRIVPGQYEADRKNDLLINKLLNITRDSVHVSEADIKEQYELEMAKINLNYIVLRSKNFVQQATASAEEVKTYYDQHQQELREPLKVSVEYVEYPHSHFSDKVTVSDTEVEEYYKKNRDTKFHQPYAIRLRHIYFRIPEPKGPKEKEKIRAKAEDVLSQAQAGKDFAELAKEYSDDFSSTSGGDTGFLTNKDILPELQDTAFGLKKDEISGVLESTNGLHIIKGVETREERTKTLEEVKDEIIDTIKIDRGTEQALQAAKTDRATVLEGKTLSDVAKQRNLSAKVTPFFREEEGLKDVGPVDAFYTTSFALAPGELSPVVEGKKAAYLIKLKERKEPELPTLEAIRGDVTRKVKEQKAMALATEKGETLLAELKKIKDIRKLAKEHNLTVNETGPYIRSTTRIPRIGVLDGIPIGGLALSSQMPIANEVYKTKDAVYLLAFKDKQPADMGIFEKQKDSLLEAARKARQESALIQFMESLKSQARIDVETAKLSS